MLITTSFEKNIIKKSLKDKLLSISKSGDKPNLFCLITFDNLLDESARYDYERQQYTSANLSFSIDRLNCYTKYFYSYLNLLDDNEPVFETKEEFLENLFINGEYKFLNFTKNETMHQMFKKDKNGERVQIDSFSVYEENLSENRYSMFGKKKYTRMKKGNVIKFFNREIKNPNCFDSDKCYLTLDGDTLSDEEFIDVFKSSNFKIETMELGNNGVQYKIHKLIKKLVDCGNELYHNLPKKHYHKKDLVGDDEEEYQGIIIRQIINNQDDEEDEYINIGKLDINNQKETSYSIDDEIIVSGKKFKIVNIRINRNRESQIIVKEY